MAKATYFTVELQQHMQKAGMDYRDFELVNDLPQHILVRNKQTGQVSLVKKSKIPKRLGK